MSKLYFFILLFLASPAILLAQQPTGSGKVSGKLTDAATKAPLGFANVVLLSAADSSLVTGATSDIEGTFLLDRVPMGRFILRISMVGYPSRFIPNVILSASAPQAAVGAIALKGTATRLNEVEITAQRPLVQYDLDKKVVDVSQDIAAESGTVAEVLQNVPAVTVDVDGNVSLRGNTNVTVLIDGKRSSLANLTLDQIPANLIESIELITNPSSKFDPEGTSGVINLILKKEKKPGFNGSTTVNAGTYDNYNTSLNLNYRYNKWQLNSGYDFRYRIRPGNSNSFTTYTPDNSPLNFQDRQSDQNSRDVSHNIRLGADYSLTPRQTISASALYRFGKDTGENKVTTRFLDQNRFLNSTEIRNTNEQENENSIDLTLGYRLTFAKKGQELTADVLYNSNVDDENTDYFESILGAETLPELQNTLTDDANTRFTAQADYVHPLAENSRLEAGFRSSIQQLDTDARFFDFNYETNAWQFNNLISNHFVYDEQVHAAYGNYSNKYKSISYQLGLRAEQTITTANQITQELPPFENNYFSLFPSVFVTKDFNPDNKLQFSYSRRINRPRSRFLDPFVDLSDKYNVDYGNPELKPEFINSLELGYLKYWGNSSFNITTFYRHTTDQIQRFRTVQPLLGENGLPELDEQGNPVNRTETTFLNLSSGTSYGVELSATHSLTNWWKLNGGITGFQTELNDAQGDTELSNSQLSWNAKLNSTATILKNLDIQLSGSYRAPMVTIQGRMEEMFSADLGLKKDVLKKRGTINLRLTDIFNTREFNFVSFNDNFRSESNNKRQTRILYLGFTYRLNSDGNNQRNRPQREEQGGDIDEDMN